MGIIDVEFSKPPLYAEVKEAEKNLKIIALEKIFQKEPYYSYCVFRKKVTKARRQCLKKSLGELSPDKKVQFHEKIGKRRNVIGSFPSEKDEVLGSDLLNCHRNHPAIWQATDDQIPSIVKEVKEDSVEITRGDPSTQCTIYSLDEENPLFSLAYEALDYVIEQMPFSSNYWRDLDSLYSLEMQNEIDKRREEMIEAIQIEYNRREHPCSFTVALASAHVTKKSLIGNCGELSRSVFFYLFKEKKTDIKVELFCIDNGDHMFIILGRERGSDPQKPETWGPHAIVCDAWMREIYPAAQILERLMDYKGTSLFNGKPIIESFNPSSQTLKLLASNITFSGDFGKESTMDLPHIKELLTEFHALPQGEKQLAKAGEIADEILQYPLLFFAEQRNHVLTQLVSQMLYLLPANWEVKERDIKSASPLVLQALDAMQKTGNIEPLRRAVDAGAKLEPYDLYDIDGIEPEDLFFRDASNIALRSGQFEVLHLAVRAGAKPSEDSFKFAFNFAVRTGNIEILRIIVAAGTTFPVSSREKFFDEVYHAVQDGKHPDFLRLAVEAGAEPSGSEKQKQKIRDLIEQGDFSKILDSDCYTPSF